MMTPDSGLLFWATLYISISALTAVTVLHYRCTRTLYSWSSRRCV